MDSSDSGRENTALSTSAMSASYGIDTANRVSFDTTSYKAVELQQAEWRDQNWRQFQDTVPVEKADLSRTRMCTNREKPCPAAGWYLLLVFTVLQGAGKAKMVHDIDTVFEDFIFEDSSLYEKGLGKEFVHDDHNDRPLKLYPVSYGIIRGSWDGYVLYEIDGSWSAKDIGKWIFEQAYYGDDTFIGRTMHKVEAYILRQVVADTWSVTNSMACVEHSYSIWRKRTP